MLNTILITKNYIWLFNYNNNYKTFKIVFKGLYVLSRSSLIINFAVFSWLIILALLTVQIRILQEFMYHLLFSDLKNSYDIMSADRYQNLLSGKEINIEWNSSENSDQNSGPKSSRVCLFKISLNFMLTN